MFNWSPKPKVSFVIAGAQKAGSTAIAHFLRQHPQIYMPEHEVHFFDRDDHDWSKPAHRDYHKHFTKAHKGAIIGEKTPIYIFLGAALERLQRYNPDMRLIVSLRSPIKRAFSHWRMETARGHETLPFSQAIRSGRERLTPLSVTSKDHRIFSYVERGFYAGQIRHALTLFDSSQLLFLTTKQLKDQQSCQLNRICDFLGAPHFSDYPANEIVRPQIRQKAAVGGSETERESLSVEDREYLLELYRSDIAETQDLTGLDLSHWINPNLA